MAKVSVNEDVCIGCSNCADIASEVFEIEDGVSKVKKDFGFEANKDKIEEAIDSCPVQAISVEE